MQAALPRRAARRGPQPPAAPFRFNPAHPEIRGPALSLKTFLLGRPLANREAGQQKIGAFFGVPAMGLDGLGSAAYGPEAMLAVLAVAGAASLTAVEPITWAILVLLLILFVSYWQTIAAYPHNGGSYTVARENLGEDAGLLAAAALMVDYVLNVAVGISAGVGALTSAIPGLQPHTLTLCLLILAAITAVNLRGTREAGVVLAIPTYLFIGTLAFILAHGLWRGWFGTVAPPAAPAPPAAAQEGLTLWLLLRAFAAGCTAMTGVEAVSNGVGAFREPTTRYARRTLGAICLVLGLLLLGIAHLAHRYGVMAMDQARPGYESVLSQIIARSWGRGWLYDLTIGSVLAVLCLSANTSFVGFPRLCREVSADGYLPRAFALPGRRLVYGAGILFLALGAGGLLVLFGGITDRLIPLFAVGAFLSFTLSQAGMAAHWRRAGRGHADRVRLVVNGLGAAATGMALAVILLAKFTEGAWLTVLVIPLALVLLRLTRRYYRTLDMQVLRGSRRALRLSGGGPPVVLVPLERWDGMARHAVEVAVRLSPEVTALHLTDLEGPEGRPGEDGLSRDWARFVEEPARAAGLPPPRLVIEPSPYRSMLAPLLREIAALGRARPGRPVIVVLSELAGVRWWEAALHRGRTHRLRRRLLRLGGPAIAVLTLPWQRERAQIAQETAQALEEEEPRPRAA